MFLAENSHRLNVGAVKLSITQTQEAEDDSIPCAYFDNSDGTINAMDVSWPQAPENWVPVQLTAETFKARSLDIRTLSVTPAWIVNRMGVG
ncbi:hypothetical protein B7435_21885 [Mycolicibacterium peregrinum]|nr:hypothetical protein B7435_21885 [Mycolicibacterium peregrinum]